MAYSSSSSEAPPVWRRKSAPVSSSPLPSPPPSSTITRRWSAPALTSSSFLTKGNWRTGAPLKPVCLPSYDAVEPGDVVLLPDLPPPKSSIIFKNDTVQNSQPWGHPAVVLRKFMAGGEKCVDIRLCTTFGGEALEVKKPEHQWQYFAMADNETDVEKPAEVPFLTMAPGSGRFHKRTYVNLSPNSRYSIEYKNLSFWTSRTPIKFDAQSTQRIVTAVSY